MDNFKEKTAEEVSAMTSEEQIKYFNDLNVYRAEKLEQLKAELEQKADKSIEDKIKTLKAEMNAANVEQLSTLQKALEAQGLAINSLMVKEQTAKNKTLEAILETKADELKEAVGKKSASIKFTVDKTTVLTSAVADSTIAYRESAIGRIQRAKDVIRQLFNTGSIGAGMGGVVRYIDEATNTNNAAMQTEGAKKAEGALSWIEKTMPLQVVAEWIKVSRQALTDFNFIASEIRNKLIRDLSSKVEDELWDGTGTAPELTGIYTAADTFTAVNSGITDASIYDLIVKVKESIMADTTYQPNVAIMNIADINKMKLKKDANNNYVLPPFASTDGTTIDGIVVVESSQVTANTMLVGDFDYATLYNMGSVDITIGYENDDFTKNLSTILAEERLGLLVRSVDTGAFNKVTSISAALVTLATS